MLPYLTWKPWTSPFILGIVAWSGTWSYRVTDYTVQYWGWVEIGVPQPLSLPTGCFSEFGRLSYLIWKRGIRVTCWSKIQHYCPTDRYFMIIFDVHLGSTDHPPHFGLSLCSPLMDIKLPYTRRKGTHIAFIWGRVACFPSIGCRVTEVIPV